MSRKRKSVSLANRLAQSIAESEPPDGSTAPVAPMDVAVPVQPVSRAAAPTPNFSQQPRFANIEPDKFLHSTMAWLTRAETNLPTYRSDSRTRDRWLREFIRFEPHLAGVMHGAMSIDANRGWHLTGGRNQVYRYQAVLHNFQVSQDLFGWRNGMSASAQSYYAADLGAVVETGKDGPGGPLRGLYHTDPARCKLTGKNDYPIEYYPANRGKTPWRGDDYFRVVSMPSTDEAFNGLGFCAVSRAMEMAKILVGVLLHDQESVAVRAPKGLLLLQGITQDQWELAMQNRKQKLEEDGWRYYEGVAVLASAGVEQIDAKLFALSQLPPNFNLEQFVNLTMYGYALAFGYDPSEFWPVQFGALGRGRETEVQHRKATHKGVGNFSLSMQEQLQAELPETLGFEFDQRDVEGERMEALVNQIIVDYTTKLYEAGLKEGIPLLGEIDIARQRAIGLLAEQGVVPVEWTEAEEPHVATDVGTTRARDQLLARLSVRRAAERFPSEPIIRYWWPSQRVEYLVESGAELMARQTFPVPVLKPRSKVLPALVGGSR